MEWDLERSHTSHIPRTTPTFLRIEVFRHSSNKKRNWGCRASHSGMRVEASVLSISVSGFAKRLWSQFLYKIILSFCQIIFWFWLWSSAVFFSVVGLTRLNGFCQFEDEIFHLIYFPSFPNPSNLTNSLSLLVACSFCLFVCLFFFFFIRNLN